MKQLYINNKRVVLNENTYFPFTHKISNLDDFTIIGLPVSKSVQVPRVVDNDEIFGHIASITRLTAASSENLIGISFNQTQRVEYELINNNEVISTGVIQIVNITDEFYEIELYDKLIDLIETFSTEETYMDTLDIITENGVFSGYTNADFIKNLNDANSEVKVLANINTDTTYENCVVNTSTGIQKVNLSSPLTNIQFRTLKNYDFEYAIPLTTAIRSINNSYDDLIEIESSIQDIFDETHLLLGNVIQKRDIENYTASGQILPTSTGNTTGITNPINTIYFKDLSSNYIGDKNGKYQLNIPINLTFIPSTLNAYYGTRKDDPYTFIYYGVDTGYYLGDLKIGIQIIGYCGSTEIYRSIKSSLIIKCFNNINCVATATGSNITSVLVSGSYATEIEMYPEIFSNIDNIKIEFDFDSLFLSPAAFMIFKFTSVAYKNFVLYKNISNFDVIYRTPDVARTGALVNGSTLFKKITIKDFLIDVCKFFNFGLKIENEKIVIHSKDYSYTDKSLLINKINNININNFNFSKLKLTNILPNTSLLDDYTTETNKIYGEQVINTGYKIKNRTKDIQFNIGVPVLVKDYNFYAYDIFTNYRNAGYSRVRNGITTNLSNSISLCYIHQNDDLLWVSNDSAFEAGMNYALDIQFTLYNEKYYYNNGDFTFPQIESGSISRLLSTHYTASPFILNTDGSVKKSLEINTPEFNYAEIVNYSGSTTMYERFFKRTIQDIYDVNCHILDVEIYIDEKIDIYKIYNYKNSLYIISEIVEYDPTEFGLYSVKLLKVKDATNYIPLTTTTTTAPAATTTTTTTLPAIVYVEFNEYDDAGGYVLFNEYQVSPSGETYILPTGYAVEIDTINELGYTAYLYSGATQITLPYVNSALTYNIFNIDSYFFITPPTQIAITFLPYDDTKGTAYFVDYTNIPQYIDAAGTTFYVAYNTKINIYVDEAAGYYATLYQGSTLLELPYEDLNIREDLTDLEFVFELV